jgi:hypothetical protein
MISAKSDRLHRSELLSYLSVRWIGAETAKGIIRQMWLQMRMRRLAGHSGVVSEMVSALMVNTLKLKHWRSIITHDFQSYSAVDPT